MVKWWTTCVAFIFCFRITRWFVLQTVWLWIVSSFRLHSNRTQLQYIVFIYCPCSVFYYLPLFVLLTILPHTSSPNEMYYFLKPYTSLTLPTATHHIFRITQIHTTQLTSSSLPIVALFVAWPHAIQFPITQESNQNPSTQIPLLSLSHLRFTCVAFSFLCFSLRHCSRFPVLPLTNRMLSIQQLPTRNIHSRQIIRAQSTDSQGHTRYVSVPTPTAVTSPISRTRPVLDNQKRESKFSPSTSERMVAQPCIGYMYSICYTIYATIYARCDYRVRDAQKLILLRVRQYSRCDSPTGHFAGILAKYAPPARRKLNQSARN